MRNLIKVTAIHDLTLGDVLEDNIGTEYEVRVMLENAVMLDNYEWYDVIRMEKERLKLVVHN